jgi:phospholipid/cholesterol/gamma-HCH transport system permease protein
MLREIVNIGYFSLPSRADSDLHRMVLALQSYTGFSRSAAEGAVATVVVLSVTRSSAPSSPG